MYVLLSARGASSAQLSDTRQPDEARALSGRYAESPPRNERVGLCELPASYTPQARSCKPRAPACGRPTSDQLTNLSPPTPAQRRNGASRSTNGTRRTHIQPRP
eukprot:scaffold843_cov327-Prasinococcus_capsulatus_cf.AAC.18